MAGISGIAGFSDKKFTLNRDKKNESIKSEIRTSSENKIARDKTVVDRRVADLYDSSTTNLPLTQLESAPDEWNFYDKLPPQKMAELIESIQTLGLLSPIIVWKRKESNKYMILSGHNRVRAFKMLYESTGSKVYSRIESIIKTDTEVDEDLAKQIIIDTNWVQRELTTSQKAKSIVRKYSQIKSKLESNNSAGRHKINELLATEYGLKNRQLINYKAIVNLLPEIQELLDSNFISIKAAVKISSLKSELQAHIYQKYLLKEDTRKFINKNYKVLNSELNSIQEIDSILNKIDLVEMAKYEVIYPNNSKEGHYKKATITYPAEDDKYFSAIFQMFSDDPKLTLIDSDEYSSGEFTFRRIK